MFIKKYIEIFVLLILISGCSHRIGDMTALSTKNIYCEGVDLTKLQQYQGVEGEDVTFLGIGADIEDAFDKAVEQHDGNLMINAVVYIEDRFLWAGYRIRGTVVKVPYGQTNKNDGTDSPRKKIIGYKIDTSRKGPDGGFLKTPVYEDEQNK